MIFTTWNFGQGFAGWHRGTPFFKGMGDIGRDVARSYAADIFNVCSAKRDYPYADHPWPLAPWPLHEYAAMEIKYNCIREFNRSNPGHEIRPS